MSNRALKIIRDIVPIALFNILFFVLGGASNHAPVWVSYAFIHLSYILLVLSPYFNKGALFGFTNVTIALAYCAVELIAGCIFIILNIASFTFPICVQASAFGIYLVVMLCNLLMNNGTAENENARAAQTAFLRQCVLKIQNIIDAAPNAEAVEGLARARELVQASPSKSCEGARDTENQMLALLDGLEKSVQDGGAVENEKIDLLLRLISMRSNTIKSLQ